MKVCGSSLNDTDPTEHPSLAFGEVFIDSPNVGSVSSMDYKSDWVITSCSASSDQPQSVRLLFYFFLTPVLIVMDVPRSWPTVRRAWTTRRQAVATSSSTALSTQSSKCPSLVERDRTLVSRASPLIPTRMCSPPFIRA
jgi:hypothetical protein